MAGAFLLDVRSDVASLTGRLAAFERREIPQATLVALNRTARDILAAERATMEQVFDRPTRFTLNALRVKPATYSRAGGGKVYDLTAYVDFKDGFGSVPAWRYLGPQVHGGGRVHKSHERRLIAAGLMRRDEYAVPGSGAKRDASGNMRGGEITRILSMLGAQADPQQNSTAASRRRSRARGHYMVLRENAGVQPGVYHRVGPRQIVPVMVFVRAPVYTSRFPFYRVAEATLRRTFAAHFRSALQVGLASARLGRAA